MRGHGAAAHRKRLIRPMSLTICGSTRARASVLDRPSTLIIHDDDPDFLESQFGCMHFGMLTVGNEIRSNDYVLSLSVVQA